MRATARERTRPPCQPPSPLRTSSSLARGFTGTQCVPRPVEAPGEPCGDQSSQSGRSNLRRPREGPPPQDPAMTALGGAWHCSPLSPSQEPSYLRCPSEKIEAQMLSTLSKITQLLNGKWQNKFYNMIPELTSGIMGSHCYLQVCRFMYLC